MDIAEKSRHLALAESLYAEQRFMAAAIGGLFAMVLSAAFFGIAKSLSEGYYYSILAAGIGLSIGFTMQYLGRGIHRKFVLLAVIYAVIGCLLGNVFAEVMDIARATGTFPLLVLWNADPGKWYDWALSDLPLADLMFWLIGIGSAAYFARRPLTYEQAFALHTYRTQG